jgi:HEAT repeat protein
MRTLILGALLIGVAAGCGRKGPPPVAEGGAGGPAAALTTEAEGPAWQPPQAAEVYQGRTLPQWGSQLTDTRDASSQAEAATALSRMGKAGYPYLVRGLKSTSDEVRLVSLQAIAKPDLVGDRNSMPTLVDMLFNARNPALRQAAASRLAWFGTDSQRAIQALQRAADTDNDAEVRRVAASAIVEIEEFVATGGKITRGQPLKKQ